MKARLVTQIAIVSLFTTTAVIPATAQATEGQVYSMLSFELESGGLGCLDPTSWVWSAPRAERVEVLQPEGTVCEIGTAGCHRIVETLPVELTSRLSPTDDAAITCELKGAQHDRAELGGFFDDKGCVFAEQANTNFSESLLVFEDAPERQPDRNLCTNAADPSCTALPPTPITPSYSAPDASPVNTTAYDGTNPFAENSGSYLDADDASVLAGVRRRVERPPTA